jgi:hypothetical protein
MGSVMRASDSPARASDPMLPLRLTAGSGPVPPFRRQVLNLQGRSESDPQPRALAWSLQAGGHRFDPGWLHWSNTCEWACFGS